jgi:PAS domain S-box-containing protein
MTEPLRILLLEDNPVDVELIQFELQEAGFIFTLKVVMTEEDYVRQLQEFSPDLILSDYDLPKYNGLLALAEASRRCPDTPFILVTGAVTEDRAIEMLTQGAKDYVLKKLLQKRLGPAISRALAEAEEHRARKQAEDELRKAHITLKKQVEGATSELKESRERLSLALTSSRMGTFEWDIVQNKRYFDDYVHLLLGTERENFSGKAEEFFRVIHPDDRQAVQDALNKAIEQDIPYETEYRVVWPDNSVHHIAVRGKVQRDSADRPLRILGVCWEITERRRTEERLQRQAALLNLSSEAIFMWEFAGALIYWSLGAEQLYGYSSEESVGRVSHDLLKTVHPQGFDHIKAMLAQNTKWTGELSHITKDGRTITVDARYQLIKDDLGRQIVLETTRDITERKKIEDAQLFLIKRISTPSGEDFFISLAKYLGETLEMDYVCIDQLLNDNLSAQTVAIYFDGKYEDNVAYTLKDTPCGAVVGKAICCFPKDVCKLFPNDIVLQDMDAESYMGVTLWSSKGKPIGLIAVIARKPLVNPKLAETILHLVAIRAAAELERRDAEEELKRRADQLEEANKELESFSYSVSHDLRAPLRAIDGYSRMILKQQGSQFDENTKHQLDVIRDNAKMMGKLIDDLLALSRLGREALSLSKLNMEELTRNVWKELNANSLDRTIDLKIGHVPPVMGDFSLITQVLVNVLSNAMKFTRAREVPLIEVGGYGEGTEVVYYVRDNGVGFDMQYHDNLFGVFKRLHSTAEYEGTGVGLAIVQRIINKHGGRVWAEGEVDKGATFYFSLPTS